jgi:hypothetical protein
MDDLWSRPCNLGSSTDTFLYWIFLHYIAFDEQPNMFDNILDMKYIIVEQIILFSKLKTEANNYVNCTHSIQRHLWSKYRTDISVYGT